MSLLCLPEGLCELCDSAGPLLDGMCAACCDENNGGPLSPWMVRVLFDVETATAPNAWREYLDAVLARCGSEDGVSALSLSGPQWARETLAAVSEVRP
ncbi:MAG TPA: hypothetical protein VHG72_13870 [Polyangia bacterium]|nr:hypothetical protein [Polyangia bacterium]